MADQTLANTLAQLQAAMSQVSVSPSLGPLPNFSTLNTVKLSPTNFPTWLRQITPYLRSQRLLGFVDGSSPCPSPDNGDLTPVDDWTAKDQLVLAILSASLTEPIMTQILDCHTSQQVWNRLHNLYSSRSNAQIVQTRLLLASLKKGGDESATDFFNRTSSLVHQVQAAGQMITDNEFVTYLLAGLGTKYDAMVTTLSTQPTFPKPHDVLSFMLLQESRINRNNSALLPTPPASGITSPTTDQTPELNFTSNRGRGRGRGDSGRGSGRGDSSGRGGRGRGRGGSQLFSGAPDTRPICQLCEKRGHTAARCWSRFDQSFQPPPPRNFQAHYTASSTNSWYPDAAATHHYTPDITNLRIDRLPYEGSESVSLADGSSVPIHNHGFADGGHLSQGHR